MTIEDVECEKCGNKVSFHRRTCQVCESDIGFPNVRLAIDEELELDERYTAAHRAASTKSATNALMLFEDHLDQSQVIMARPLSKVIELANSDNQMLSTFYSEVNANGRIANDNEWDHSRQSVDSAINPMYTEYIHFGVMSLGRYGVKYYGNCHIKLKDDYIKERTSFFEENPFIFFKKQGHIVGNPIPRGFRSDWKNKAKLAVAKLHSAISAGTSVADFKDILVSDAEEDSDFIEAHIFGAVNKAIFDEITVRELSNQDAVLLNAYLSQFESSGIKVNIEK